MSRVLYRKYRARNFSEIIGQDAVTSILQQANAEGNIGHAYLFTGPRGTGKTSVARIMAKAVNCENLQKGDPCGKCQTCLDIEKGTHIDLVEIDAASHRGVDEIRDLRDSVGYLPAAGKTKVYIIDEVHMLTNEAFNALLKTLEEPPANILFVLATTEVHKVPITIISRTQRFDFKLASDKELRTKLTLILDQEGVKAQEDALDIIIKAGNGSYRDAETVLEKVLSTGVNKDDHEITLDEVTDLIGYVYRALVEEFLNAILSDTHARALQILDGVSSTGVDMNQFISQLLDLGRDLMLIELANGNNANYLAILLRRLVDAQNMLKYSVNALLPLQILIAEFGSNAADSKIVNAVSKPISKTQSTVSSLEGKSTPKKNANESAKSESVTRKEDAQVSNPGTQVVSVAKDTNKTLASNNKVIEDVSEINNIWDSLMGSLGKKYKYLATIIHKSLPVEIKDGDLILAVPFGFHKKKLEEPSVVDWVNEILVQLTGKEINRIVCKIKKVDNSSGDKVKSNEDLVNDILI